MPVRPLGLRQLVLLRSGRAQGLKVLPLNAGALDAEGSVRLAVVPTGSAFECRSSREISFRAKINLLRST